MPLLLTVSCFSKIQIGFTFLVPAHPGSPGQRAVKRVCVCVCVCWCGTIWRWSGRRATCPRSFCRCRLSRHKSSRQRPPRLLHLSHSQWHGARAMSHPSSFWQQKRLVTTRGCSRMSAWLLSPSRLLCQLHQQHCCCCSQSLEDAYRPMTNRLHHRPVDPAVVSCLNSTWHLILVMLCSQSLHCCSALASNVEHVWHRQVWTCPRITPQNWPFTWGIRTLPNVSSLSSFSVINTKLTCPAWFA